MSMKNSNDTIGNQTRAYSESTHANSTRTGDGCLILIAMSTR